ncbi:MAG: polysaccharide pyruvyl transferase family protein [Prevotellaceae bacterium]|jgi:hypothetical protein|nr:polysaccharide pyruvyl transferase family protein [Prevotellaceae bacterium]
MTKKIALVTCYFQHNYGSQLQALATQLVFDKLRAPNETVCIEGLLPEINRNKYRYFLRRIFDINTVKDKFATVKKLLAARTKGETYRKNMAVRHHMFEHFSHNMFHLSQQYNSKTELSCNAYNYAAFVAGSDQLWLPSNIEADYYTLNFVPDDVPKMSFSTSFGIEKLPKRQAKKAAAFLKRLDFCSVREQSGQKQIKELTGRHVPVTCDPVMLLTAKEWNKIAKSEKKTDNKYLFCYFLGNNPEQRDFVKKVKKKTGLTIVQLPHNDEYIASDEGFADIAPYDVGPAEFISLIRDAEFVFTDSFHCTVFSLLFEKMFFTFKRYKSDSKVSTNGRLYSLMLSVNLENRLLSNDASVDKCLEMEIDYPQVLSKLNDLRQFTKKYLCDALTKIGIQYDTNYQ